MTNFLFALSFATFLSSTQTNSHYFYGSSLLMHLTHLFCILNFIAQLMRFCANFQLFLLFFNSIISFICIFVVILLYNFLYCLW